MNFPWHPSVAETQKMIPSPQQESPQVIQPEDELKESQFLKADSSSSSPVQSN
jgi:hypothetical protein